jgi:hypothetical protein
MSFQITEAVRGKENDIWVAVLLAISFACIWSVLYIQIAKRIIKTDIKLLLKSNKLLYLSFAVIVIVFTILSWFNEISMSNPTEEFTVIPFLSLFAFLGWIVLTGMIVVCLVLFFVISSVALKLSDNHPKIVSIIALVFFTLWSFNLFGSGTKINPKTTVELCKIFIPVSSEQDSMNRGNDDWYFVYNNRIYAYLLGDYDINNSLDVFFSIDFEGKGKKIISDSEELRLAQFYAVENGEAYYFSSYDDKNRKINLETGKISMTDKTYAYFPPEITAETLTNYNINANYDKKRIKHINRQDNIVYIVYYEGPLDDQAYYNLTPKNIKVYKHSL